MIKAQTFQLFLTMFSNINETYPLLDFLEFCFLFIAFAPVDLLTITTEG